MIRKTLIVTTLWFLSLSTAFAMGSEEASQFQAVKEMTIDQLAVASAELLNELYPGEDWSAYRFPGYVRVDRGTEMAYRVAVKKPRLLGAVKVSDKSRVIPCYCSCGVFGHDNLLYCFYRQGDFKKGFDSHGAQCSICVRQALMAFLWDDLGATHAGIIAGMEDVYADLLDTRR